MKVPDNLILMIEEVGDRSPNVLRRLLTGKTCIPMVVWKRRKKGCLISEVIKLWIDGEIQLPQDLDIEWNFK